MQHHIDKELLASAINMDECIEFLWEKEISVEDLVLNAIWEEMGVDTQIPLSLQNIVKLKEKSSKILSYDVAGCNIICNPFREQKCYAGNARFHFSPIESWVLRIMNVPGVEVNLEKLIIYEEVCHYEHSFYFNQLGKIGTVALQVPVEGSLEGGVFSLAYNGTIKSLKSASSDFYQLAAFYDCCENVMEPVTHGHKLTIFFSITWAGPKTKMTVIPRNFPVFLNGLQKVIKALKPWTQHQTFKCKVKNETDSKISTKFEEDILFFVLQEKYEKKKQLSFEILRGQDRVLLEVLMHCDFVDLHLTVCTTKSKEAVGSSSIKTSRWIDSKNAIRNLKMNLNLDEQYVGPKENLLKLFDVQSVYIGLVIWPKKQTIQIYGRYGGLRAILLKSKSLSMSYLRRVILFCCSEPRRVWTQSGMQKGELTLSLLRLCITFRARDEGLILLKSIGSYFDKPPQDQERDDTLNFEGIQNEEVAKAIADFEHCVTGWNDISEVIKPLISPDRLAKQLVPCIKLAGFFLITDCVEGAKMVGDGISHFFLKSEVDELTNSELQCFIDMIVSLKSNPESACQKRMDLFIDFCSKLDLEVFSRLILDYEIHLRSKKSFQGERICNLLCEILSNRFNVHTIIIKDFIVDLVRCFAQFGIPHLQSFIYNICRRPKMPNLMDHESIILSINKLLLSPQIWELLASTEEGRQSMIILVDCQFKLLNQQETSIEEKSLAPSVAKYPIKMLSTCIRCYMQMGRNHPKNLKRLSTISALLPNLALEELMEILFDFLIKYTNEGPEKSSFIAKLCALILSRMKEKVTNMPSRNLITETVRCFLKFENALTSSLIMQVCANEISGSWDHHLKLELFQDIISSSDIWEELNTDSISEIIKTSSDLLLIWISDISENISSSSYVIESKVVDCIKCFFIIEKNRLGVARSVVVHFLELLMSKLSSLQLMDISLAIFEENLNVKDVESCFQFVRDLFRLQTRRQDFVLVNSAKASNILLFLLWLNDEDCWQNSALKICSAMPSDESENFIQAAVFDVAIRQALGEFPFAATALEKILDCWTKTQKSWMNQPFTWKQPFAVFREYPEVEVYLRSTAETMTYASFSCIKEAHNFAKLLDEKGPTNGFSLEVLVNGKGRKSYIEMAKNKSYHKIVMKKISLMHSKLEDVSKLRQYLVEQEHERNKRAQEAFEISDATASSEKAMKSSEDEECIILPPPKRAKQDTRIVNIDIDELETRSSNSGYVNSRDERDWGPQPRDYCFKCNQEANVHCICLGPTSGGRGRGRHSRFGFKCNQRGHASYNDSIGSSARRRGVIQPVHMATSRPHCFKGNQGHVSSDSPYTPNSLGRGRSHVFF